MVEVRFSIPVDKALEMPGAGQHRLQLTIEVTSTDVCYVIFDEETYIADLSYFTDLAGKIKSAKEFIKKHGG